MQSSFGRNLVLLTCVALFSTRARAIDEVSQHSATQQGAPTAKVPTQQKEAQTVAVQEKQSAGGDKAKVFPEVEGLLDCAGLHTGKSSSDKDVIEHPKCQNPAKDDRVIEAGIGNEIAIKVKNLKDWTEKDESKPSAWKLVPYIDDRPLPHLYPKAINLDEDKLSFDLALTSESKGAWMSLLSPHEARKLKISVGLEDKPPFSTQAAFKLRIFQKVWVGLFALVFLLASVALVYLAARTSLLREPGPIPTNGKPKAFSLARSQMAVWFFVILACFIFILVITWDKDILPDSVLTLMGISAGTYLGAVLVDSSKRSDAQDQLPPLETELTALNAVAAPTPQQTARINELKPKIAQLSAAVNPDQSHGFWLDILSDANGVSLHRFQMVVWTGIVVIIFVKSVWSSLVIPELNGTLLGLMGISSGTYIGSKFPEQKK